LYGLAGRDARTMRRPAAGAPPDDVFSRRTAQGDAVDRRARPSAGGAQGAPV